MNYEMPKFHLTGPKGWLNDPNGLCRLNNMHHIFFQYSPGEPLGGLKCWGHYETEDFIHYRFTGEFLKPDREEDRDGVYSGSAYVENDQMYLFYTGNVKKEGDYDYIYSGREGNTLLVTSKDGRSASKKECLLKNVDYPEILSNHVRDPKVFKEKGIYYMVLGGRTRSDQGCVLLYTSKDLRKWTFSHLIQKEDFGYMWECPDIFSLEGETYLSVSPQGLLPEDYRFQNVYQSGYFKTSEKALQTDPELSEFTEWDYGFDFYAPQTYEDEKGRRLLIGWMGVPDAEYAPDPTVCDGWQHMLTMPRELKTDPLTGKILQTPAEELKKLRKESFKAQNTLETEEIYELLLTDFAEEDFCLTLDQGFTITYKQEKRECCFTFTDPVLGGERTSRKLKLLPGERIEKMQIFADTCALEIFLNDGSYVFTTKIFPEKGRKRSISMNGASCNMEGYLLEGFQILSE